MASIKLENLEMWQDLNEHELEVIRGGDDKSASSNNQGKVSVPHTAGTESRNRRSTQPRPR